MLIKSFEGFRPRAIRRENGGWVIGYGHCLSAREGATVSEADAELLLRYDLLPVEKSVNDTVPAPLNQHQFDALVSFAFSLGLERFAASDVLARLVSGAPEAAAEAMMGWPEPWLRETALRRRTAERALFIADPAGPVALSDLLAAPLAIPADESAPPTGAAHLEPEPMVPAPSEEPQLEAPETVSEETVAEPDARSAAVAALLGESAAADETGADQAAVIPIFADPEMPEQAAPVAADPAGTADPVALPEAVTADEAAVEAPDLPPEPDQLLPATEPPVQESETALKAAPAPGAQAADPVALAVARYAPYSAAMVGPLPYLLPAAPRIALAEAASPASDIREIEPETVEPVVGQDGASDTMDPPTPPGPAPEPEPVTEPETGSEPESESEPETESETEPKTVSAPVPQPEIRTISFASTQPGHGPRDSAPQSPFADTLVLTPMQEASEPAPIRPLWTPEQRADPEVTAQTGLFEEDLVLTRSGGALLRHEVELQAPARFDWSETGAFIIMGAVGLTAFGASMAAFRLASEQSNGGAETSLIAWVLAIIGAACVGVSSFNLYRRWGLPGGD
ncbi:MAG: glycoside hydrolase family protein [Brevundimonas sp.]|uniref:glycoside hydrolase family protein n=1 Tax=Brevundimonas sp. TaxID=1871086 RepID=UPI00273457D7|nr:glycoside hydrolase family protein [Brevundimonas sp.]MDP3404464.1 glycoside hydrolase family protein [Brevundimonas sp.]